MKKIKKIFILILNIHLIISIIVSIVSISKMDYIDKFEDCYSLCNRELLIVDTVKIDSIEYNISNNQKTNNTDLYNRIEFSLKNGDKKKIYYKQDYYDLKANVIEQKGFTYLSVFRNKLSNNLFFIDNNYLNQIKIEMLVSIYLFLFPILYFILKKIIRY